MPVRCRFVWGWVLVVTIALAGCSSKPKAPEQAQANPAPVAAPAADSDNEDSSTQTRALSLPTDFKRQTGDWDAIVKRGHLRVLTIYNKQSFFYDKGRPKGIVPEAMGEFEQIINKKLKTGAKKFKVMFIPIPPGQLLQALNDGTGDLIASGIIMTPEREKLVDFTVPVATGVKLVVVSSKTAPAIASVDDLSGKDVYVNPTTLAKTRLQELNQRLRQAGKAEVNIKEVDKDLTEEDLLEMVNAGVIPATVAFNIRAQLWAKAFTSIVVTQAVLEDSGNLGWAMRKNSPQLKAVVDDFVKTHAMGTSFGNTVIRRYVDSTKFIRNSTTDLEMKKFQLYVKYFQQYATEYNFDYLMLAAQGYQESLLEQNRVSPRGAVGVMQVLPKYAAADPINIRNVHDVQSNIHAGTKMLAQITNTYFNDPGITPTNKTLLTFAAYNAGPNRIARLRKQAQEKGLDPNVWFGNVELMVADDIGSETVQYVSNIYKYYVAYKLTIKQEEVREAAKGTLQGK